MKATISEAFNISAIIDMILVLFLSLLAYVTSEEIIFDTRINVFAYLTVGFRIGYWKKRNEQSGLDRARIKEVEEDLQIFRDALKAFETV